VRLLDKPPGWESLQYMAQQETDPEKLGSILESINRLLEQHEQMNACGKAEIHAAEVCSPKLSIRRAA
jgi:hypothetical protein